MPLTFTEGELKLLELYFHVCPVDQLPRRLAELGGYKTAASANTAWYGVTKKIRAAMAASDTGDGMPQATQSPSTPKTPKRTPRTPKVKSAPKSSSKAAAVKSEPVDDDVLMEDVFAGPSVATPSKTSSKKRNKIEGNNLSGDNDEKDTNLAVKTNTSAVAGDGSTSAAKSQGRKRKASATKESVQGVESLTLETDADQQPAKKRSKPSAMQATDDSTTMTTNDEETMPEITQPGYNEPEGLKDNELATGDQDSLQENPDARTNQTSGPEHHATAIGTSPPTQDSKRPIASVAGRGHLDSDGIQCLLDAADAAREDSVV